MAILSDLGYEKVFTIFDNDEKDKIPNLKLQYPQYEFYSIITDDIRDKKRNNKIDKIIDMLNELDADENQKAGIVEFINAGFKNKKGLVTDIASCNINKEYEENIFELLKSIKEYFKRSSEKIYNKKDELCNQDVDDRLIAEQLLEKWLEKNRLFDYSIKKYKRFQFNGGGGGPISLKKIKEQKYYAMVDSSYSITQNYYIIICYHIIINTRKNKVKLKKKQIISNTLPISKLSKLLEKIFN